ncbi:ribonuclease HI [Actinomadura graeca]|uniref:Ribonuclease H n=1 Tax=Actinomadura graeca TaxID=2750812 RepID=A0ABX8R446_9ACTN|nr:ribonuclease H [Actinomadura graeca]QXJ25805.1 ribonuclease HI [Actinomadura graeca]
MPNRLIAACDGACKNNPGPAGWGWVIADADERVVRWACGPLGDATNNVAELAALQQLLLTTDKDADLEIRMDSKYAIDAVTKWLPGWKARGWKTASKKPVANRYLIEAIDDLLTGRTVVFVHVRAHQEDGDFLNALADRAANAAATSQQAASGTSADEVPPEADDVQPRRLSAPYRVSRSAAITAKFPGICRCGEAFKPGDEIVKGVGGRWGHPACAQAGETAKP